MAGEVRLEWEAWREEAEAERQNELARRQEEELRANEDILAQLKKESEEAEAMWAQRKKQEEDDALFVAQMAQAERQCQEQQPRQQPHQQLPVTRGSSSNSETCFPPRVPEVSILDSDDEEQLPPKKVLKTEVKTSSLPRLGSDGPSRPPAMNVSERDESPERIDPNVFLSKQREQTRKAQALFARIEERANTPNARKKKRRPGPAAVAPDMAVTCGAHDVIVIE